MIHPRIHLPYGIVMNRGKVLHQNPKEGQGLYAGSGLTASGSGMGSILLGGSGNGSAYSSLSDYIHTTGKNPFSGGGIGMKRLSEKLSDLQYMKKSRREPNISFSI